jgi:ubiquinone/menaquinone biosynthesis C-methylase UbiE
MGVKRGVPRRSPERFHPGRGPMLPSRAMDLREPVRRLRTLAFRGVGELWPHLPFVSSPAADPAPSLENGRPPDLQSRFSHLSDDAWSEVVLGSLKHRTYDGAELPGFPKPSTQIAFTSLDSRDTVKEGFQFFRLVKDACERNGRPINKDTRLLDFGVGWGRIARMFLKDISAKNVFGVDVNAEILEECRRLMPYGTYSLCKQDTPLEFPDESFDVITAFSVFSHLSQPAHMYWLKEFHRVLRPGGTVVLTTLSRSFLETCFKCADNPKSDLEHHLGGLVTQTYPDWRAQIRDFDRNGYLYLPSGGGITNLEPSHYGWAMVPLGYAKKHWSEYFAIAKYNDDAEVLNQAYFYLRKPYVLSGSYSRWLRER